LVKEFSEYERQAVVAGLSGNEFNDSFPIVPHLMSDAIGFIMKESKVAVYEKTRVILRPMNTLQAFDKV
jgi:hypothetical protein